MKKIKDESEYLVYYYFEQCDKYKKLYEKCAVLIHIGSFFEIYGLAKDMNKGMDVQELSDVLEIQCTKKNKSKPIVDITNPYMCGFNLCVSSKFIDILLDNGYTVILIEQTTPPPNPKREVTQVISPATRNIENSAENNYLMAIYFTTGSDRLKNKFVTASLSYVDVNTNHSYIFETCEEDTKLNLEDIYKTIMTNKPSEIIVFTDIATKSNELIIKCISDFVKTIPVSCIHNKINSLLDETFFKLSYQKAVLEKVFSNTGLLSIIEYLDLERNHLSTVCYTYLLQFCYEHSEKILEGLIKPVFLENKKFLNLINNVVQNLNIISKDGDTSKTSSVLNLLNNCKTPIGKRYFKECLLNPLTNVNIIRERYDAVEYFIKDDFYDDCIPLLSKISDLERIFKRVLTKSLQPSQLLSINKSMIAIQELYDVLIYNKCDLNVLNWSETNQNKLNSFVEYIIAKFDIDELSKNIFNNGVYPQIDKMESEIVILQNIFENVGLALNEGNENNIEFKLEISKSKKDSETRYITVTKNRYETMIGDKKRSNLVDKLLKEKCNLTLKDITSKPFSASNKTTLKIMFTGMDTSQIKLLDSQNELKTTIEELYQNELEYISNEFGNIFGSITQFIGKVDFYCNNAKNAVLNCYCKPNICESEDSYIKATKNRHILVEKLQVDTPYISNDIEIGTEDHKGMLLYGYNGVGKSSMLKSIGINLILAQAGMYVGARSFEFSPYDHIFSRIPSGDNILKNQSTFVVEISELRTVLKRCTNRSLIISDELCSGSTEYNSALSIIASAIVQLSKKKTSFLMASHLHAITDLECVKTLNNINIYHMEVVYDVQKDCLIYNRTLRDGQGSRIYGLEVCKSLDMPVNFLLLANQVRQELEDLNRYIVKPKTSVYNSEIYMDKCSVCDKDCEEVHHIQPQKDADSKGIIKEDGIHKNRKSNLINVCQGCHDAIHTDKIKVGEFKCTSNGVVLDIDKNFENINNIKNVDINERIKNLRHVGTSYVKILEIIKGEFKESNINLYQIRKILK